MIMSDEHNDIFFVCWIIERFYRVTNLSHKEIVKKMGKERIKHYLDFADVFHCENPDKIVGELANELDLPDPPLYNVVKSQFVSDITDMGMVYYRLVRHSHPNDYAEGIYKVMTSFLPPLLSNCSNNLYWSNKEYLLACYKENELL